jgi:hypothetical protein
LPLYLAQSEYWKRDDPIGAIIVVSFLGAALAVWILIKLIRGDFKRAPSTGPKFL